MVVDIGTILYQLESVGVYDFLLPFLLVFALVFGVLTATNITGPNKGVNVIIALVIGFMSLRLGFMQAFFSEIFPRLGVGLAIILSLIILVGLFIPDDERRYWMWGFGAVGVTILIIIMVQSFDRLGFIGYGNWEDYVGYIIGAVLLLGLIIAVAVSGGKKTPTTGGTKEPAKFTLWREEQ